MSRSRKAAGIADISLAWFLGCTIATFSIFRYQPAAVAAPVHEMRWPMRPALGASVVKSYQRLLEIRICHIPFLGWSAEDVLFSEEASRDNLPQVWAYSPARESPPHRVETAPLGLIGETVPRALILEWARSPGVRPADAEPMVRSLEVRADGLASPGGRWVAVVVCLIYDGGFHHP
jgi:hypothetical protein